MKLDPPISTKCDCDKNAIKSDVHLNCITNAKQLRYHLLTLRNAQKTKVWKFQ